MSRKPNPPPWRVIALSMAIFVVLAVSIWLLVSPSEPADTSGSDEAATTDTATPGAPEPPAETPPSAMPQQTGAELDPSTPEGRAALAANRAALGTMDLRLFVIVPGVERLVPVARTVAAPPTLDGQVRRAVEELIAWNSVDTTSPLPPETRLRETWVSPRGIAYLDFDRSLLDALDGGSLGELHAVYGVVASVTESFPEITAVQFLLDGKQEETLTGHVDLSQPLLPSDEWVLMDRAARQIPRSDDPS